MGCLPYTPSASGSPADHDDGDDDDGDNSDDGDSEDDDGDDGEDGDNEDDDGDNGVDGDNEDGTISSEPTNTYPTDSISSPSSTPPPAPTTTAPPPSKTPPTSTSSPSSTPPAPPPSPPPVPSKIQPIDPNKAQPRCNPSPTGKFPDINGNQVANFAHRFCQKDNELSTKLGDTATNLVQPHAPSYSFESDDPKFNFTITQIPNCEVPKDATFGYPLGKDGKDANLKCDGCFLGGYGHCTGNAGRGGAVDCGCFTYTFRPDD